MGDATESRSVVTELYNRYQANGFITEDEALACFVASSIPLSEIDAITEQLLNMGVLIRYDDDTEDEEGFSDRSRLDYNKIFQEVLTIAPGLETFIEYVKGITPPQTREAQNLIPQAQSGNLFARNRLIEMYLRTVIKQALYDSKRYSLPLEDTLHEGVVGLMLAIRKFDSTKHDKFSIYASRWVRQIISRSRRLRSNPMYFPTHVLDKLFLVQEKFMAHDCIECVDSDLVVCPALVSELCQLYDYSKEDATTYIIYLQQWLYIEDIGADSEKFSDCGMQDERLFESVDAAITSTGLEEALCSLTDREKLVIRLRFGFERGEPMTLEETGSIFGLTRERIRQIEAKALRKLRHPTRTMKYQHERASRKGVQSSDKKHK